MKQNWHEVLASGSTSKAAYPEAMAVAKEIASALGKEGTFIDPMTTAYRVSLFNTIDYNIDQAIIAEKVSTFQRQINDLGYTDVVVRPGRGNSKHRVFAMVPYTIKQRN